MPEETSHTVPQELQTQLDLDLKIRGLDSAVQQQQLESAFANVPGIAEVHVLEDKVTVRYDPQQLTKARIFELIESAGFSVADEATASPAPSIAEETRTTNVARPPEDAEPTKGAEPASER